MYIFNYIYLSIYIYLCFACLFSCCCRFTAARRRAIKYAGRLYWGQRYARGPACGGRPAGDPHLREQQAPGTATAAEERVNDANKLLRTEELWSMEQMSLSCSSGWMFIQDQTLRPAFNLTVFLIWLCSSTIYLLQHYFGSFLAMVNIFVRTCFFSCQACSDDFSAYAGLYSFSDVRLLMCNHDFPTSFTKIRNFRPNKWFIMWFISMVK